MCDEEKDTEQFYKDNRKKDGLEDLCLECAEDNCHISNIYIISGNNAYKIGESKNPEKRLKQLQTGNPWRLKLIKIYEDIDYAYLIEQILHKKLDFYNVGGEWFQCDIEKIYKIIDNTLDSLNANDYWKFYEHGNKYEKTYVKERRKIELSIQEKRQEIYNKVLEKHTKNNEIEKQPECPYCNSKNVDVARNNNKYISNYDINYKISQFYCLKCKRYFSLTWEDLL
jgi:hypothetical protein